MKMLKIILGVLLCLFVENSFADSPKKKIDEGKFGVDLGAGLFSNYGLVGGGLRYFISDWEDVHAVGGIDLGGLVGGLGTRFYYHDSDRCLFIIPCESRLFFGLTGLHVGGGDLTITDGGASAEYRISPAYLGHVSVGTYETFAKHFSLGFELGYRVWLKKETPTYESGAVSQSLQSSAQQDFTNSVSLALTVGVLF